MKEIIVLLGLIGGIIGSVLDTPFDEYEQFNQYSVSNIGHHDCADIWQPHCNR